MPSPFAQADRSAAVVEERSLRPGAALGRRQCWGVGGVDGETPVIALATVPRGAVWPRWRTKRAVGFSCCVFIIFFFVCLFFYACMSWLSGPIVWVLGYVPVQYLSLLLGNF